MERKTLYGLNTVFFLTMAAIQCHGYHSPVEYDFISDYIAFYDLRVLTFLDTNMDTEEDMWPKKLVSRLLRQHEVYVAVSPPKTFEGKGDSGSSRFELVVARLLTHSDLLRFSGAFSAADSRLSWLLLGDMTFANLLREVYLPINSKVVIAAFDTDGTNVSLWEAYQVRKDHQLKVIRIGEWTAKLLAARGIPRSEETMVAAVGFRYKRRTMRVQEFPHGVLRAPIDDPLLHRDDLTGLHLRCVTGQFLPLTVVYDRADGTVTNAGVLGALFDEMAARMNFTYTCRRSRDGEWGALVDGRWTGIIRDLIDNEADVGASALDVTQERARVVAYLHPLVTEGYRLFMRKPTNNDYMWSVYVRQFSVGSWITIVMAYSTIVLVLYWTSNRSAVQSRFSFGDSVVIVSTLFAGQGTPLPLMSASCRITALMALMLHVLLLAYYTSDLVSSLTAGPPNPTMSTLQEVYNNPAFELGFVRGTSLQYFFKESKDASLREIWKSIERKKDTVLTPSIENGIRRVMDDSYVFLEWGIPVLQDFGNDCRLWMLPTSYFDGQTSFTVRKDSPFVAIFNKVILDIFSSGLMEKWRREWSVEANDCARIQIEPVGIKTVFGPFLLMALTSALSFCILACERLKSKQGGIGKT